MSLYFLVVAINGLLLISVAAIILFTLLLTRSIKSSPRLKRISSILDEFPSLDIIIPAYNEADGIVSCVQSVLSAAPEQLSYQVWIVDDQSTDDTGALARGLEEQDPHVHALTVSPRPPDQVWYGKNWACTYGAQFAQGEYLLFLDADVRLLPGSLEATLRTAQDDETDLLSCAPKIECSCLAEWLVQPIIMSAIAIGYNIQASNRSTAVDAAFAAGPFMLFRREAYETIGGHALVHDVIVEDIELARQIRRQGLRSEYLLGIDLIQVYMYSSLASLWEGWTKNYFLGTGENILLTLFSAFTIGMVFVMPWIGLWASLGIGFLGLQTPPPLSFLITGLYGLTALSLGLYLRLRIQSFQLANIPIRYWWLSSLGGILVMAIAVVSIVKTKTGWGWTWKGRSLGSREVGSSS